MKTANQWLEDCPRDMQDQYAVFMPTEDWIRSIQWDAVLSVQRHLLDVGTPDAIADVVRRVLAEMRGT